MSKLSELRQRITELEKLEVKWMQVKEDLRQTNDYLDNIIESSLDGIVVSDHMGYITRVNKAFLKLIDFKEDEVIGKHITEFTPYEAGSYESTTEELVKINEDFIDNAMKVIEKLFEEGKISHWESYYLRKDRKIIPVEMNIAYLYNDEGDLIGSVGINRDITERRRAEKALMEAHNELEKKVEERTANLKIASKRLRSQITRRKRVEEVLRKSEKKYRILLENLPQRIFHKDRNLVYVSCNKNYAEDLNIKPDEIVGKTDYDFYPKELAEKYRADDKRVIESGNEEMIEERYIQDRKEVIVQTVKTPIKDDQGDVIGILGIFWDITERKKAEKKLIEYQNQLRSLASQLTLAEEHERRRFATYLHDHIGQTLFGIHIKLDLLKDSLSTNDDIKPLEEAIKSIQQMIKDARLLTFELSPPVLYESNLESALDSLVERMHERYGIMVTLTNDKQEKPLDDDIKVFLFQAVRELLINVVKHAQAKNVNISIQRDTTRIRIHVEDDGVGFTPLREGPAKDKKEGFGLFSIRERLNYIGGSIEIESQPGHGTKIGILSPLKIKKRSQKNRNESKLECIGISFFVIN